MAGIGPEGHRPSVAGAVPGVPAGGGWRSGLAGQGAQAGGVERPGLPGRKGR